MTFLKPKNRCLAILLIYVALCLLAIFLLVSGPVRFYGEAHPVIQSGDEESIKIAGIEKKLQFLTNFRFQDAQLVRLPVLEPLQGLPAAIVDSQKTTPDQPDLPLLTVIVGQANRRTAIVDGHILHVGERLDAHSVITKIGFDVVELKRDGATLELKIGDQRESTASLTSRGKTNGQ